MVEVVVEVLRARLARGSGDAPGAGVRIDLLRPEVDVASHVRPERLVLEPALEGGGVGARVGKRLREPRHEDHTLGDGSGSGARGQSRGRPETAGDVLGAEAGSGAA